MSEQLGIDGSFGDGSAIDCNVAMMFPGAVVVDYLWEELFPRTALPRHEDGHVGRSHLCCHSYGMFHQRTATDDAETLFDLLYIYIGAHGHKIRKTPMLLPFFRHSYPELKSQSSSQRSRIGRIYPVLLR